MKDHLTVFDNGDIVIATEVDVTLDEFGDAWLSPATMSILEQLRGLCNEMRAEGRLPGVGDCTINGRHVVVRPSDLFWSIPGVGKLLTQRTESHVGKSSPAA